MHPNRLVFELAQTIRDYPTAEKVLVVPNLSAGQQLLEQVALAGVPWLGLRPATATNIASELVQVDLARQGLREVGEVTAGLLVEEALAEVGRSAAPGRGYFARVAQTPGLVSAVYSSVIEVRLAGIRAGDLSSGHFVDPDKGREFVALLQGYERRLKERRLVDRADVLRLALDRRRDKAVGKPQGGDGPLYLIPAALPLRGLERALVEAVTRGRRRILGQDPVFGLEAPAVCWLLRGSGTGEADPAPSGDAAASADRENPLSWLFDPAHAPAAERISIFHANSTHNEVREVFRRILGAGAPLDQVELICTETDHYTRVIEGVARKLAVPVTFAEGVPVLTTRPGRAVMACLRWLATDWGADALRRALAAGDLEPPTDEDGHRPSGLAFARTLRRLGIGWGRDRYLPALDAALREHEARVAQAALVAQAEHPDAPPDPAALQRKGRTLLLLKRWLVDLLEALPGPPEALPEASGEVNLSDLCAGLAAILDRCAVIASDSDAAARQALRDRLTEAADAPREPQAAEASAGSMPMADAVQRVTALVTELRVGSSGPRPGHIHVTGWRRCGYAGRTQVFVLGLDEGRFPGAGLQDPVLLDEERQRISPDLPVAAERVKEKTFALALALAGLRGHVTFSYASFDPVEDRAVFPASILLQAYRLRQRRPEADYSELGRSLGAPVGCGPPAGDKEASTPLDPTDWWMGRIIDGDRLIPAAEAVRRLHPGLDQGLTAQEGRDSDSVTPYDGQIKPDPDSLDPRRNAELVLSASAIEKLGTCPLAYFFRYVLHVKPPDDLPYDPSRWLDALQRGRLLHDLFCRFLRELRQKGVSRPSPEHRDHLLRLAGQAIEEFRREVPPPGEQVFEYERQELLRSVELFLKLETSPEAVSTPRYFELAFGFDEPVPPGEVGQAEPVRIELGQGEAFQLCGRVDRVDRRDGIGERDQHWYQVWDYKTGSAFGYEDEDYWKRGRQVQHALYAVAVEHVLRSQGTDPEARVITAGYLFPTEKGEGRRINRMQNRRGDAAAVLATLFDLAGAGTFVAAEDGYGCEICDYAEVCGGGEAAEQTRLKLEAGDRRLEPLLRLRQYG